MLSALDDAVGQVLDCLAKNGLAERFDVITFDNRGTPPSDCPAGPYTVSRLTEDLAAVIEEAYRAWAQAGWNALAAPAQWGGQDLPQALNAACIEMWNSAAMAFGLGPVLVDVRVTREENCYPMIPAGQAARDMVG